MRTGILIASIFLLASCNGVQTLLHRGRPEQIYARGRALYEKGKWEKASLLFESAAPYYAGTEQEDSIAFMHARSKFKSRNYPLAAEEFDLFRQKFLRSPFVEQAEGMLALSYYYLAPPPQRDQAMTMQALVTINEYLSHYPEGENADAFRQANKELTERLHEKAYENAYTYYKTEKYKSAIVALREALKKYPDSARRERMMYLVVLSSYELAVNSVLSKQHDRYLSMLDSYYSFVAEYPDSEYVKELDRLAAHTKAYLEK